jgi:phage shock protein PspC (stress-responsive transcriptional regulator)
MFSKKNIYTVLIIIILLGAFLRFYKLGNNSFVADEFLDINSTYSYFKTGEWQSWDFNWGKVNTDNEFQARDERAWVYKLPVAMLFKVLSPTESVARSVSVLWGILSIILVYLTAAYFTKQKMIGLIAAFLFAISIDGIEFDRKLRMYAMFLPVYLAFSWLLFRFLESRYEGKIGFLKGISKKLDINPLYLIPAVLVGILSLATHQLTANIVFIVGAYLILWSILNWNSSKNHLNKYTVILGLGILGIIGSAIVVPKTVSSFIGGLTLTSHWEYIRISLSDYTNGILASLFVILGIYFIIKKQKMQKEGSFLAMSFLVVLFSAVFLWHRNVGNQYIFFIKPFGIILIASGIYFSAKFFKDNLANNYGKKAFLSTIILALLILPNYAYFFEGDDNTYNQTSKSSNPNYRKIFTYFKKYKKDGDVLITRNFRSYYWSGAKVEVFDFGGELEKEKLSLEKIKDISEKNPNGWFIISDNDKTYISSEAIDFIEKNFEKVSNPQVRGDVMVYKWGE